MLLLRNPTSEPKFKSGILIRLNAVDVGTNCPEATERIVHPSEELYHFFPIFTVGTEGKIDEREQRSC